MCEAGSPVQAGKKSAVCLRGSQTLGQTHTYVQVMLLTPFNNGAQPVISNIISGLYYSLQTRSRQCVSYMDAPAHTEPKHSDQFISNNTGYRCKNDEINKMWLF